MTGSCRCVTASPSVLVALQVTMTACTPGPAVTVNSALLASPAPARMAGCRVKAGAANSDPVWATVKQQAQD